MCCILHLFGALGWGLVVDNDTIASECCEYQHVASYFQGSAQTRLDRLSKMGQFSVNCSISQMKC